MTALVLPTKCCTKCGEVKSLSQFYVQPGMRDGRRSDCKSCATAAVRARNEALREEMGDEAWLAHKREIVRRSRARRGPDYDRAWNAARGRAISKLIKAHRAEYDTLFHVEKYEAGLA